MRRPRFQSRPLFRSYPKSLKPLEIKSFLLKMSRKDIILDYSQLRIACLHFLSHALPAGSTVATSCYTIFDMVNVIINAGHKPFFVDIEKENLGPNIPQLIELVRTEKVQAVIYTHLHGYKADLSSLASCCKEKNCLLIEDCAQSLWNKNWDKIDFVPGSFGNAAIYSTGFFKGINTICGGLLTFNKDFHFSEKIINSHRSLKRKFSYDFIYRSVYAVLFKIVTTDLFFNFILFPVLKISWSRNFVWMNKRAREENNPRYIHREKNDILRMNLLQKFLLVFQSKNSLDKDYLVKLNLSNIYFSELEDLIKNKIINIPGILEKDGRLTLEGISSLNQIPMLVSNRKELLDYLICEGFDIAAQHIRNLSQTPPYNKYQKIDDIVAEDVVKKIILLPCYPSFSAKNVHDLSKKIKSFYT